MDGENDVGCNRIQYSRMKQDKTYQIRVEYTTERTEQNRTQHNTTQQMYMRADSNIHNIINSIHPSHTRVKLSKKTQ